MTRQADLIIAGGGARQPEARGVHGGAGQAPRPRGLSGGCGSCSARASPATQPVQPPRRTDKPAADGAAPPRIKRLASSQIQAGEEQTRHSALTDRGKCAVSNERVIGRECVEGG